MKKESFFLFSFPLKMGLFIAALILSMPTFSMENQRNTDDLENMANLEVERPSKNHFDLHGHGIWTNVRFPYDYYERKEGDILSLIHQGGYKIFNIAQNQTYVAVIGPLRPCIAVVVTDSENLVAFHKHSSNALNSMKKILLENISFENIKNLYARIFTTEDNEEWNKDSRSIDHGNKTHREEVKRIKDFLETMGIRRPQIGAQLYDLKKSLYPDRYLGRYELAESCIAIRLDDILETKENTLNLKFTSIDPYTENIFGYKGTMISYEEYFGSNLDFIKEDLPTTDYSLPFILYDDIQKEIQKNGDDHGYWYQRGICEARLKREEKAYYMTHFGVHKLFMLFKDKPAGFSYDSLDFFPL